MFPGGISDKLGNRFEAKWIVKCLLDVIRGDAQSLRWEGIDHEFEGFEFALKRNGITEWHQCKINTRSGNWTLHRLTEDDVLVAFKSRLEADSTSTCHFISEMPAVQLRPLSEKVRTSNSLVEFEASIGGVGDKEILVELAKKWGITKELAYAYVERCFFTTFDGHELGKIISGYSGVLFKNASNGFTLLRDFLEVRLNENLTTDLVRKSLTQETGLELKDHALDPTLRQKLKSETDGYLLSYAPFSNDGRFIPRNQSNEILNLLDNELGSRVILVKGAAGTGKSGVIRGVVDQLEQQGIIHLALRVDQLADCRTSADIGAQLFRLQESPVTVLEGLDQEKCPVLIIDQVDAVSEVSGRDGRVRNVVLGLIEEAMCLQKIRVIVGCRSFDIENDALLRKLSQDDKVGEVEVPLLDWALDVEPFLSGHEIDASQIGYEQRALLTNPFNLNIFIELGDSGAGFVTRSDLLRGFCEKKCRELASVVSWDPMAALASLAEHMNENKSLKAPEGALTGFPGALDHLASAGLIVHSRGNVSFLHECLFDFIYARSFAIEGVSLTDFLLSEEQHLFRRTQVRLILESLRQLDPDRYLKELQSLMASEAIRYHIKIAVAQWVGALNDPMDDEIDLILELDIPDEPFSPITRNALLGSAGWFLQLSKRGWVGKQLESAISIRVQMVEWWVSRRSSDCPTEVALVMQEWWGDRADRTTALLDWLALARRGKSSPELISLCEKAIRFDPAGLFEGTGNLKRELLLSTWAGDQEDGGAKILDAFLGAWFDAHPGHHPFDHRNRADLDTYAFEQMVKKYPRQFIEGVIPAFLRAIEMINKSIDQGVRDTTFSEPSIDEGYQPDEKFISLLKRAFVAVGKDDPGVAENLLREMDPSEHVGIAHLYLETIASNGEDFSGLFLSIMDVQHIFLAGWNGAVWKSFADAAAAVYPHLTDKQKETVEKRVRQCHTEFDRAINWKKTLGFENVLVSKRDRGYVIYELNQSGKARFNIFQTIGKDNLSPIGQQQLEELERKFNGSQIDTPEGKTGGMVRSPIQRASAERMSDAAWLKAMEKYPDDDREWRREDLLKGGARQLSNELSNVAKAEPPRFVNLLHSMPYSVNEAYVSGILSGLREAPELLQHDLVAAIEFAHAQPGKPFGREIAWLLQKHPSAAANNQVLQVLLWYIENGEANLSETIVEFDAEKAPVKIEDFLAPIEEIRAKGFNTDRGAAVEALGTILWDLQEISETVWEALEAIIDRETSDAIRVCLVQPLLPLLKIDPDRCVDLVSKLIGLDTVVSLPGRGTEAAHQRLAFPYSRLPLTCKRAMHMASELLVPELLSSPALNVPGNSDGRATALLPLATRRGVHLLPFLMHQYPAIGRKILSRLVRSNNCIIRAVGTWHILQAAYNFTDYQSLSAHLMHSSVSARRMDARLAAGAIVEDEFSDVAEAKLKSHFDDSDVDVRKQAGRVFSHLEASKFEPYLDLAEIFIQSPAFSSNTFQLMQLLEKASCNVALLVVAAAEKVLTVNLDGNDSDHEPWNQIDIHHLQDLLNREYASTEDQPILRTKILNIIDRLIEAGHTDVEQMLQKHDR